MKNIQQIILFSGIFLALGSGVSYGQKSKPANEPSKYEIRKKEHQLKVEKRKKDNLLKKDRSNVKKSRAVKQE